MANGDTQETTKKDSKVADTISGIGDTATKLGEAMETLFGPSHPAPGFVPSHVSTGPPQVATPPGGFSTSGGGGGQLPPVPQPGGSPAPPPPGVMQTGTEFRTSQGKNAAVVGGAIGNISGALHNIAETKKKEGIQHAQFLYDLVKTSYENGDERTANLILGDDKSRKTIEKYLTGKLPRLSGSPERGQENQLPTPGNPAPPSTSQPAPPGKVGDINRPGGPALPRASQAQQQDAAIRNMIMEGLKNKDPRIMSQIFGEQSALSKEDYSKAVRAKFGIELAPAQIQALDQKAQLALAETKADVLKYVIGQGAMTDRAVAVAKIHAGAEIETGAGHDRARLEAAKLYRDTLVKIKGSKPDAMEGIMYKGLSDLYSKMAQNSLTQSGKLAKDNPKLAKQYEDEANQWALKAENMKSNYEAGKLLDDILDDTEGKGVSDQDEEE